ncbi:M56 family metallopeptidase [Flavobacterium hauense]
MESLIIYIAKASGLLAVFFIAYHILLRKETFFSSNRGFLIAGLFTSTLLPLAEYTKTVLIEPVQQAYQQPISAEQLQQLIMMQKFVAKPESFSINWYYIALVVYAIGVLFFLTRFIMDFLSIRRILKGNKITKEGRFRLIDSEKVQSPFSFFNYIVYNSAVLQPEELESIMSHEKVHSNQRHSADMIISQLFCIAFWFNPFMWLYKKAISQNLEFIADAVAIKQLNDKKAYQRTLLKITIQPECIAITNHFYQSLIKKRIVMLNKKQSKRRNSWKYGIVLPALAAFIFLFQVKVVAQEKNSAVTTSSEEKTKMSITIDKDATDDELKEGVTVFKEEFDADVTYSDLKRNASGEITSIKINVKDKTNTRDFVMSGNGPIRPFSVEIEKSSGTAENTISFGNPSQNHVTADKISVSTAVNAVPAKNAIINTSTSTSTNTGTGSVSGANLNISKGSLVIVNGVLQKENENDNLKQLQLPKGQAISNMKVLSPKEAKKKYGKPGKNGAVEIDTKQAPMNYTYAFGNDGDAMNLKLNMPDMDNLMAIAANGVNVGMDAVANIDWQSQIAFEGITEEERREIQEELKKAHAEIQQAMKELKIDMSRESLGKESKDQEMKQAMKQMEQAKLQMKEAQKQLEEAQKEVQQAQKEMDKKKALSKKS